jgi:hypothetical protein
MTLEQLDQYGKLKTRCSVLHRKIRERKEEKVDCLVDVVEGSNKAYPFQRVHFSVAGLDPEQLQRKSVQLRAWEHEISEIETEMAKIDQYVATVTDPIVKTAMELYFIGGATWPMASTEIYGNAAQNDALRMAVQRYVKNNP